MAKFYKVVRIVAACLGCLFILSAFISNGIPVWMRIRDIIIGLALLLSIYSPTIRSISFSIAGFIGGCLSAHSIISNAQSSFWLILFMIACFCCAAYFGYHSVIIIKSVYFPLAELPRQSKPNAEPTCIINTEESQVYISPVNQARVEFLIRMLGQRNTPDIPVSLDLRDSFALYGGANAELLTIDLMEGHDFEYWCAAALEDMDFTDVEVTPGSGDQGVDILAKKNSIKYAIQCKRYTDDLGNTPIQEVHAGKALYHCHVGVVITNRYFTSGAKQLAEATGVLLWDRDWIIDYLNTKADENGTIRIAHGISNDPPSAAELAHDEMLPAAVDIVLETQQASVSMIERRLHFGYARAARIVNEMEELGIIGPFRESRPREIYLTKAEWDLVKSELNI